GGAGGRGWGCGGERGKGRGPGRGRAEAGEMMLDQKGGMVAQRLGLDIVFDELPIALTGIHVRPAVTRGGAAEQTKAHALLSCLHRYSSSCRTAGAIVYAGRTSHDPDHR